MDVRNRRVTVMGLGSFGGGLGAVQYLVPRGAQVTVTDLRSAAELQSSLALIAETPPAQLHLGGHRPQDFTDAELIVVNPAVNPQTCPYLRLARDAGVPLTSEMNLFIELNPAPVVGVTGSNGKSTTTAMVHAILEATLAETGRTAWLGGNIGRSLLPVVDEIRSTDVVVLELSSFQLEDLNRLQRSPHIAIVTNFSPNHLDRHQTLDAYRAAKQAILNWQAGPDIAILNLDDADVASWPTKGETLYFGLQDTGREGVFLHSDWTAIYRRPGVHLELPIREWLQLPGRHNLQNALAATCAALAWGATPAHVERGLRGYRALPHRLELVAERLGRRFYNDSLATTPESAIVGIQAFTEPVVLLAGGYDKGSDLADFARAMVQRPLKAVALMGSTGPTLEAHLASLDPEQRIPRQLCQTFPESFQWALEHSAPGDVVLLSPGCASYDWFRNFAERGRQFRQLAEALPSE